MRNMGFSVLLLLAALFMVHARADSAVTNADLGTVNKALAELFPESKPDSIVASPLPGLYEAVYGTQVIYISQDGRYVLQGDLLDVQQHENLTELKRSISRLKVLSGLNEKDMIIFSPKQVKHTVTVFTDIDCAYCRKLHKEMAELNDHGIRVRYVAYPRAGVDSPSYYKAVSVWCAKDRNAAITAAKADQAIEQKTCDNPVKLHMQAAKQLGIAGTPTLVLEDGSMVKGYVPANQLIQFFDDDKAKS